MTDKDREKQMKQDFPPPPDKKPSSEDVIAFLTISLPPKYRD